MSYLGRSAKLSLKAQEKVSFLATAGQTVKTGLSYTPSFVEVYVNGVLLTDTTDPSDTKDFTATNGNSITFTVALLLNDEVTVISLKTFTVADHYTKSDADTLLAAKAPIASPAFTGNVGIGTSSPISPLDVTLEGTGQRRFLVNYDDSAITIKGSNASSSPESLRVVADTFKVNTGTTGSGSERMRIDSSGNVGIGVVPEAWNGSWTALQLGATGFVGSFQAGGTDLTALGSNVYSDGSYKYIETDEAAIYKQQNGTHIFDVAASGTADAAISWNTAMTIDNAGITTINDATASAYNQVLAVISKCTSRAGVYINQQNASYGDSSYGVIRNDVVRAASSAWNFEVCRSGDGSDTKFKFRGDGNAYADGAWSGGGADYAEYFEWSDGNPSNEDRRGYSVILEGNKIRQALVGETPMGVISGNPSVVGDAAWSDWDGKYLTDDFGTYILEEYTVTEWEAEVIDVEATEDTEATYKTVTKSFQSDKIPADEIVPSNALVLTEDANGNTFERRTLNSDWNPDTEYVPREDRQEWDTVGLMGKLRIIKGQPVDSRWIKMRDVSDAVEEWLVR